MIEKLNLDSQRRIKESWVWWVVIWTWVSVERLINQWADIWTTLSAWWIQCVSTFFMALGSISFYDCMVKRIPWELSESMKKIAIWWFLATFSWFVNYIGQLKTQWSIEESIVMFSLAWSWLLAYEHEIIPKIKLEIENNKCNILENILYIGNTLWLK